MQIKYIKVLKLSAIFLAVFGAVFGLTLLLAKPKEEAAEKLAFPYQTATIDQLSTGLVLSKPGTVLSAQDVVVTSQVNGRVSRLAFKEGAEIKGGAHVVMLADTVADYALQVQRAKNALDRALLTKQQTLNTLDQQTQQSLLAYENAQKGFELASSGAENTLKQADFALINANNQIDTLKRQFESQRIAVLNFLTTVTEAGDKLLGVTEFFEDQQTGFENYVGAKDLKQKIAATRGLIDLYVIKDNVVKLSSVPETEVQLQTATQSISEAYQKIEQYSLQMVEVLRNSIASEGVFPQSMINSYIQQFQSFQEGQAILSAKSSFIAYNAQVQSQLLGSGTLAQDSAQLSYDTALLNTKGQLFNAEVALKNSKIAYETLLANREVQIGLLDAAIADAKIAYESALTQYAKLTVRSPISGVIGEIFVSEGQEIAVGTKIFTVSGKRKQQIQVAITANEYQYIQQEKPVVVEYQNQILTGTIDSISPVADKTNLFKVIIQLSSDIELLGDVAKVNFPLEINTARLLPLEKVKIVDENQALVAVLSGGSLEYFPVEIHSIWGEYVELKQDFPAGVQMIITDLAAFDESKYHLE